MEAWILMVQLFVCNTDVCMQAIYGFRKQFPTEVACMDAAAEGIALVESQFDGPGVKIHDLVAGCDKIKVPDVETSNGSDN